MKQLKNNKIIYFIICVVITTLLDLYTTDFIINNYNGFHSNLIDITYCENSGAAFSLLEHNALILSTIGFLAILSLIYYMIKKLSIVSLIDCFFVAMLVSGIFCNSYERCSMGFVRDFFKLNTVNFPIFNISDILINVSVIAIMIIILKYKKKRTNNE